MVEGQPSSRTELLSLRRVLNGVTQ